MHRVLAVGEHQELLLGSLENTMSHTDPASPVIPGLAAGQNPESRNRLIGLKSWIPGSRRRAPRNDGINVRSYVASHPKPVRYCRAIHAKVMGDSGVQA
jgi:hypothetical protein